MNRYIRSLALMSALVVPVATPSPAAADGDQLFFAAWGGPAGSMSQAGQAQSVIYLRWDLVEGLLPPDVARFKLYRGATVLLDTPVNAAPSVDRITTLYAGAAQDRRRAELIDTLNRGRAPGEPAVTASNYAAVLAVKLGAAAASPGSAGSFTASTAA